ncbi:MAG: hypothetical protein K9N00_04145 [Candidatus Marinimicrobia bacterium]|nr:hypothetical protein [Candidatus Neomarinimicrobiota bacterium]
MGTKEFIHKVRKELKDFQYWQVEHLIKAEIINPIQRGSGRPREFSKKDVRKAVKYYSKG